MAIGKLLTENNISEIKEFIRIELLKRGIHANIKTLEEVVTDVEKDNKIRFESENFQTTPVMFKTLKIIDWSTHICTNKNENKQG